MAKKIALPNNCYCSVPKVYPSNWKSSKASMHVLWYIHYRFYSPSRSKPKQKIVKGMNDYIVLSERQDVTQTLLENEITLLKAGYNPLIEQIIKPAEEKQLSVNGEPTEESTLIACLEYCVAKVEVEEETRSEIAGSVRFFKKSAEKLQLDTLLLKDVKRKIIKQIIDNFKNIKKVWNANQFNVHKSISVH